MSVNHLLAVARRKVNAPEGWKIGRWEVIGDTRDVLVHGCVPGVFQRGPRKGQPKFNGITMQACVVTDAEERAEHARYEAETGLCGDCGGERQVWAGWHHIEGTRYRPCRRCAASGRAPNGGPL